MKEVNSELSINNEATMSILQGMGPAVAVPHSCDKKNTHRYHEMADIISELCYRLDFYIVHPV